MLLGIMLINTVSLIIEREKPRRSRVGTGVESSSWMQSFFMWLLLVRSAAGFSPARATARLPIFSSSSSSSNGNRLARFASAPLINDDDLFAADATASVPRAEATNEGHHPFFGNRVNFRDLNLRSELVDNLKNNGMEIF